MILDTNALSAFADDNILQTDAKTAKLYAQIRYELKKKGSPIPYHDIGIGALALQHRLQVISKDKHFDNAQGIKRISW